MRVASSEAEMVIVACFVILREEVNDFEFGSKRHRPKLSKIQSAPMGQFQKMLPGFLINIYHRSRISKVEIGPLDEYGGARLKNRPSVFGSGLGLFAHCERE